MDLLFLVGRILFGGFFLINGINHLTKTNMLVGYAGSKNVPAAKLAVLVSGLLILAGGAGVVLGVYIKWSLLALILFLVPVSFKMHAFWKITDPMQKMGDQVNFMKNMALLGATLMLYAVPWPWAYSFNL